MAGESNIEDPFLGPAARLVEGPTPKHAQLREILRRLAEEHLPPAPRCPRNGISPRTTGSPG